MGWKGGVLIFEDFRFFIEYFDNFRQFIQFSMILIFYHLGWFELLLLIVDFKWGVLLFVDFQRRIMGWFELLFIIVEFKFSTFLIFFLPF